MGLGMGMGMSSTRTVVIVFNSVTSVHRYVDQSRPDWSSQCQAA